MASVKQFEDLEIWKLARILCDTINKIANRTDLRKDHKLYSQIDGSSGSVMDNIAEGFERNGNKEFVQFLSIAKASCGETRSQLYRVFDRNYITTEEFHELKEETITLSKMIGGFMNYLKKSDLKGSKYKTD
ncbi:four helix bundle protein [uncultured Algibacter sp.]|uniref:four helix bundle protein n=1 Tax=uncultured Algibacter sp. TaxID=298659 RepID=UPI0030ED1ECE|tara:strand:+ start:1650 stop:2045 length:396 start_codon:yes stop_codon:yes gene_type:complete